MDYNQPNYEYNYYDSNQPPQVQPSLPGPSTSNYMQTSYPLSGTNQCPRFNPPYNNQNLNKTMQYNYNQSSQFYNDMNPAYNLPYQNEGPNRIGQQGYDFSQNLDADFQRNSYNGSQQSSNYKRSNDMNMIPTMSPKYPRYDSYSNYAPLSNDPYSKTGMKPCRESHEGHRNSSSRNSYRNDERNQRRSRDRHGGHRRFKAPSNRVPMPRSRRRNDDEATTDDKETVRLAYNLFRPPASRHVIERKINTLRTWQDGILSELNPDGFHKDESLSKSTTLLSDVAQKLLKMNMVFLYAFVEEIPPCESNCFTEQYGEWDKTAVLSEMYMDDIFISQGIGSDRMSAREFACQRAFDLFKEGSIRIIPVARTFNGDPLEIFCASCCQTMEEAVAKGQKFLPFIRSPWRDSNKKVPWLQTNARVNSSGPKEEELPYDQAVGEFFLLIDNGRSKDKQPSSILNNSAQFNRVHLDYKETAETPFTKCTVLLHGHEFTSGTALDSPNAKNAAAHNALQDLQKTQPLIKMRLHKTRLVSRAELDGYAKKLAEEKGYRPNKEFERSRMKEEHLAKLEEESEAYFVNYVNQIKESLNNPDEDASSVDVPLKFDDDFTHDEKMAIHKAARRLQLTSKPYGPPKKSHLLVSSHYSLLKSKQLLLHRGHAGRYELVSKGTRDFTDLLQREESESSQYVMLIPPFNQNCESSSTTIVEGDDESDSAECLKQ